MAEYRFKTQVIFTVEANSEQEALQQLFNATSEELYPAIDGEPNPIRFNTMREFEPLSSEGRRKQVKELLNQYGRPSFDA